jgi:hypothetical protein
MRASRSSGPIMSILLSTSQRGLSASSGSYLRNSLTIARASRTGSASGSNGDQVDQVQQQAGALQVAQELMPQPGAFGGALDQAGNVGHHEALLGPIRTTPRLGCSVVNG